MQALETSGTIGIAIMLTMDNMAMRRRQGIQAIHQAMDMIPIASPTIEVGEGAGLLVVSTTRAANAVVVVAATDQVIEASRTIREVGKIGERRGMTTWTREKKIE
jgi:hypothetical protein